MLAKTAFYVIESGLLSVLFWLAFTIILNGLFRLGVRRKINKRTSLFVSFVTILIINTTLTGLLGPESVYLYHAALLAMVGSIIAWGVSTFFAQSFQSGKM